MSKRVLVSIDDETGMPVFEGNSHDKHDANVVQGVTYIEQVVEEPCTTQTYVYMSEDVWATHLRCRELEGKAEGIVSTQAALRRLAGAAYANYEDTMAMTYRRLAETLENTYVSAIEDVDRLKAMYPNIFEDK